MSETYKLVMLDPGGRHTLTEGTLGAVQDDATQYLEACNENKVETREIMMLQCWTVDGRGVLYVEKPGSDHEILWNDMEPGSPFEDGFEPGMMTTFEDLASQAALGDDDDPNRIGRLLVKDASGKVWNAEYEDAEREIPPYVDMVLVESSLSEHGLIGFRCKACGVHLLMDEKIAKDDDEQDMPTQLRAHAAFHQFDVAGLSDEEVREKFIKET